MIRPHVSPRKNILMFPIIYNETLSLTNHPKFTLYNSIIGSNILALKGRKYKCYAFPLHLEPRHQVWRHRVSHKYGDSPKVFLLDFRVRGDDSVEMKMTNEVRK